MIFVDIESTKDSKVVTTPYHHKVVSKKKLPIYKNHISCGVLWKDAIYIAGGEVEG
jgi:hypothetical protein